MTEQAKERLHRIKAQAQTELDEEYFAEDVKQMKIKLRQGRWWHTWFPFQIIIRRRKS